MNDGEGEQPDLDAQYRRIQPALLRHLRHSSAYQAEDIAADVWAEVATHLARFEGDEDDFRAWVFTLARRRLIDSYRRDARRRTEPLPGDFVAAAVEGAEDGAVARMSVAAIIARLHDLLPPDQAEVLLLRVVAGLSVEETALITSKRPVNVRVLHHRALRRLASRFGPSQRSA